MPLPRALALSPAQEAELRALRERHPKPHVRERAAAVLKVAGGWSARRVAREGLLRPRRAETVAGWVARYRARGAAGLGIDPGRGRKPLFPPLPPAAAAAQAREAVRRSPRLLGVARSRWTLAALGAALPWLRGRHPATVRRVLRRLGVRHKRGRRYLHSPDPAYDAKLAALTAAQALARAHPGGVVLLDEDEFTYRRRPSVAAGWAPAGADAPRAAQGLGPNRARRVAACLDATTGALLVRQRHRFDRFALGRFLRAAAAAYPDAEAVFVALDNWPVHFHPDLLNALPARVELLPLPTYAPWTTPTEKVWHRLNAEVLHLHGFADDWPALRGAVEAALARFAADPAALRRYVGLDPTDPCPE